MGHWEWQEKPKRESLGWVLGKGMKGGEETGVGQDRSEGAEKDKTSLQLKDRKVYTS